MYIGSVRFFKHMIIVVIILIIFSLLATVVSLSSKVNKLTDQPHQPDQSQEAMGELEDKDKDKDADSSSTPPDENPDDTQSPEDTQDPEDEDLNTDNIDNIHDDSSFAYQEKFPQLHGELAEDYDQVPLNTVYLTFDDGVLNNTSAVLDELKEQNVKATFFVVGSHCEGKGDLLRRIVNEGHSLGIHSYSHDYNYIYSSVDAFLEDFNRCYQLIYDETGMAPDIFRFPGGSINAYNQNIYQQLVAEMTRRGFTYYDWHYDTQAPNEGDAAMVESILEKMEYFHGGILLFHDPTISSSALGDSIEMLKNNGYTFEALNKDIKPTFFPYTTKIQTTN